MMTPEKIDGSDHVPGLTSVDMRVDKDDHNENRQNKKRKKKVKIKSIDEIIEEELANDVIEDDHIDFHA